MSERVAVVPSAALCRAAGAVGRGIVYALVVLAAASMVIPFVWMVRTSLMSEGQAALYPPQWFPAPWAWGNYVRVSDRVPLGLFVFNSLKIATLSTIGGLLSCSLAGYAFARLKFPGREGLFIALLATLMIPGSVTFIPLFVIYSRIGWIDTHLPFIVPAFLGNAFGIFLLRQFFLTLPQELFDAAVVDGASPARQFAQLAVPLSKPALATLALFSYVGSWGNLFGPLVYLRTAEKMTLPVSVVFFSGHYWPETTLLMAASTILAAPMVVLFLLTQRYFVQGIALTGLKG